jgi:hypothetical protein
LEDQGQKKSLMHRKERKKEWKGRRITGVDGTKSM